MAAPVKQSRLQSIGCAIDALVERGAALVLEGEDQPAQLAPGVQDGVERLRSTVAALISSCKNLPLAQEEVELLWRQCCGLWVRRSLCSGTPCGAVDRIAAHGLMLDAAASRPSHVPQNVCVELHNSGRLDGSREAAEAVALLRHAVWCVVEQRCTPCRGADASARPPACSQPASQHARLKGNLVMYISLIMDCCLACMHAACAWQHGIITSSPLPLPWPLPSCSDTLEPVPTDMLSEGEHVSRTKFCIKVSPVVCALMAVACMRAGPFACIRNPCSCRDLWFYACWLAHMHAHLGGPHACCSASRPSARPHLLPTPIFHLT